MLKWILTKEAKLTLLRNDCFGFDYAWQAAEAILSHPDWNKRWETHEEEDVAILQHWKESVLIPLN